MLQLLHVYSSHFWLLFYSFTIDIHWYTIDWSAWLFFLVATDFGKHHLILILTNWFSPHKERAEWFSFIVMRASSLLDVPVLCLILHSDLMIQSLSLFVTLWLFTTQSSGIIHYTRTLRVYINNLPLAESIFYDKSLMFNGNLPVHLHTHLVARKNQVRKHIIVKSLNRKIIWHIQFKHR